ncbi:(Fe-S)-binding protein [Natroniella acetigena]|uniref:(Fe-S)-binding protein n=1 Tax=Natroniella acetigena TaxID=52004 RepID=UPI00200B53D1|nr:(Fe-S)-binding protein [Natroniella acetigena]MCK8826188.1 (Fe-S)-binding protein [Natroniella acetigena]
MSNKILAEIEEEAANCMKCGLCRKICPIFDELENEATVARGKVNLIQNVIEGNIELTDKYEKLMELCLLCKACVDNCPVGIEVDKMVFKAREHLAKEKGLSWMKKGIFSFVKNKGLFPLGMKLGATFQGLAFCKNKGSQQGNNIRVGIGMDPNRVLPDLAKEPFRDRYPEIVKLNNSAGRVAFFTGCSINYMQPDFGESVVNVLLENDIEVVIPKEQHCCGLAIGSYGDIEKSRELAEHNLDVFSKYDVDAVVTACASCGSTLKEEYEEWLDDDSFSSKVYDISEYLVDVIDFDREDLGKLRRKVTYHDPCHLVRGMKVSEQPREIMKSIPGLYFEDMKKPDRCCGAAGTFNIKNYDLSMKINRHKIDDIKQTGAGTVATGCAGCKIQITDGLNQAGMSQEVVHTVQLLDEAYQKRREEREEEEVKVIS